MVWISKHYHTISIHSMSSLFMFYSFCRTQSTTALKILLDKYCVTLRGQIKEAARTLN